MYTLIEIFDAKQYENILTPFTMNGISKIVYVGSKDVMTNEKVEAIKRFFSGRNTTYAVEFLYVERDNSSSVKNRFMSIIKNNNNCIFDATGGEDVLLANMGIIAERYNLPIVRTDTKSGNCIFIHQNAGNISVKKPCFHIDDFITLQGAHILQSSNVSHLTTEEAEDIATIFSVNASNCEAYSAFCNVISEFVTQDNKQIIINITEYKKKLSNSKYDIESIFNLMLEKELIYEVESTNTQTRYKIKSPAVALCLKKSGNALEYYTALSCTELNNLNDVKVGVSIDWDTTKIMYDTQNEIDVMAVCDNLPLFISCKNGEIKKEALYELDAISRALGGSYSKRVLVCTYISKNKNARMHFIKRAHAMGIGLVYDVHKKTKSDFLYFLRKVIG